MRLQKFTIIFLWALLATGLDAISSSTDDTLRVKLNEKLITSSLVNNSKVKDKTLKIVRGNSAQPVFVAFPNNMKRVAIFLYDSTAFKNVLENRKFSGSEHSLRSNKKLSDGNNLNLSGLEDGEYFIHLVSYERFGFLKLKLSSKKPKQRTTGALKKSAWTITFQQQIINRLKC